jgi:cytochrome bd-type quinol oxidase subunit 2
MTWFEWTEMLSYVVTIVGLPLAIIVFIYEQRRERQNEEEELYQRLSDEYTNFLKLVLEHPDLHLLRPTGSAEPLTAEQKERKFAIFNILVSLFERAYILVYEDKMDRQTQRLWLSWEDFMREWCRRADFRATLPELLQGEDKDFRTHILALAQAEAARG